MQWLRRKIPALSGNCSCDAFLLGAASMKAGQFHIVVPRLETTAPEVYTVLQGQKNNPLRRWATAGEHTWRQENTGWRRHS
jgi:hypothetical protein